MSQPAASAPAQLAMLAALHDLFAKNRICYWLFGGWAVDFHAGRVTREHADVDVAVWWDDLDRVAALLTDNGWVHAPDEGEDGYTCYERDNVRLEVAFLARANDGQVYTPIRDGRGEWPAEAFGEDTLELSGVQARVISLDALVADKSISREDSTTSAKDRADLLSLGHRA